MEAKEMKRKIIKEGIASLFLENRHVATFSTIILSRSVEWDVEESVVPGEFDLVIDGGSMIIHFDQVK